MVGCGEITRERQMWNTETFVISTRKAPASAILGCRARQWHSVNATEPFLPIFLFITALVRYFPINIGRALVHGTFRDGHATASWKE